MKFLDKSSDAIEGLTEEELRRLEPMATWFFKEFLRAVKASANMEEFQEFTLPEGVLAVVLASRMVEEYIMEKASDVSETPTRPVAKA